MNKYLICCNGITEWHTCTKDAILYLAQRIADSYNNIVEIQCFNGMNVMYEQVSPKNW